MLYPPIGGLDTTNLLLKINGKRKVKHSQPSSKQTKPARRKYSIDIHELPAAIPTLEMVRHAKTMHVLAENMQGGYATYLHVIEAFNDATAGEFLKHFLEVNR